MVKMMRGFFLLLTLNLLINVLVVAQNDEIKWAGCWIGFDMTINRFADSLNFIHSRKHLPVFLQDYLIDWRNRRHLSRCMKSNPDEVLSFRKAIIDRIVSKRALKWIIRSKNKSYDRTYEPSIESEKALREILEDFPPIPFMEYSIRDLAKMRLKTIRETRRSFKKWIQ